MLGRGAVLALIALLVAGTASAAGRLPQPLPANICVTPAGWCDLPVAAPLGYACTCLAADSTRVEGVTKFLGHVGPRSPYLRPHVRGTAPTPAR
jgi:hypothetical protein